MKLNVLVGIISTLLVAPLIAQEPTDVTLVQLIANPEKFDGRLIRVIGFLRLEFEGDVLYLHREDFEKQLTENGLWLNAGKCLGHFLRQSDGRWIQRRG
jgi:hypothetical protein